MSEPNQAVVSFMGLPADSWVAVFTLALTISTTLLWVEARANRAEGRKIFKLIERPYVHFEIVSENIKDALDFTAQGMPRHGNAVVRFALRNYGRTLAYISHVELSLIYDDGGVSTSNTHAPYASVIGPNGGASDTMQAELERTVTEKMVSAINTNQVTLRLFGFFNYENASGEQYSERVVWTYNPTLKRMVQVLDSKAEATEQ